MRDNKTFCKVWPSFFLILTLTLTFSNNLIGAVIRVPNDHTTIQAGIDAANNSDTVVIADGTYTGTGNRDLDFNGKAITVISENGPYNCIIDCEGEGRGFYFHNSETQSSILSGITITNGYADSGGGIRCTSSPTITNCRIIENTAGNGGGIYFGVWSATVINSVIAGNTAAFGSAIYSSSALPKLINCTMIRNTATTSGAIAISPGPSELVPTITNCILWDDPSIFFYSGFPYPVDISNCNLKSTELEGETIIHSDPLFTDVSGTFPLEWDLHLLPSSPCIDAGDNNAPGIPATDIDGDQRIIDGDNDGTATVDIGADELQGDTQATVNGTLTLPADASGKAYIIAVDTDTEGSNSYIAATVGTCSSGTTVNYSINAVPEGIYYVWAVVRLVSAQDSPAAYGDYIGFYGTGLDPPVSVNATVPDSGTVTFDITLSLWSDPSDLCPDDSDKTDPGICGCGIPDTDTDSDGTPDCNDGCPNDPDKTTPGTCGCNVPDTDTDADTIADCIDSDDDDDGIPDNDDVFPLDDTESLDTDEDGTGDNADLDDDNDGINDTTELSGPNAGDGNNDGTQDHLQNNVACLESYTTQGYVVLETPPGISLSDCQVADNPSPVNAPTEMNFDYGFFDFTISGLTPGGSTSLTMTLPSGVTADTYYKYSQTPANPTDHWYEFMHDGQTGAEINANVITLHFVDALRGDDDLTQDSKVIDLGAPGFDSSAADLEPTATITSPAADITITAGDSVNFEGSVISGNTPFTFAWDFGGGASNLDIEDPEAVAFSTAGTYTVTFTVTDDDGDISTDSVIITVNADSDNDDNGGGGGGSGGGCFIENLRD